MIGDVLDRTIEGVVFFWIEQVAWKSARASSLESRSFCKNLIFAMRFLQPPQKCLTNLASAGLENYISSIYDTLRRAL